MSFNKLRFYKSNYNNILILVEELTIIVNIFYKPNKTINLVRILDNIYLIKEPKVPVIHP